MTVGRRIAPVERTDLSALDGGDGSTVAGGTGQSEEGAIAGNGRDFDPDFTATSTISASEGEGSEGKNLDELCRMPKIVSH